MSATPRLLRGGSASGVLRDGRRSFPSEMKGAAPTSEEEPARFVFAPTTAVTAAREHSRFVRCPACQNDNSTYLFHRTGVRFVRCRSCGAVYVNPARQHPLSDLDIERARPFSNPRDR